MSPEDLILRPRNKLPTKSPNAFIIYRMQYVKELHAGGYRLTMRSVSTLVASAWREEPDHIVKYYKEIAREVSKIYSQKYLKPLIQPRSVIGKQPVQRSRSGLNNLTSTPLLKSLNDHNGHDDASNHVDDTRQHHYNPIRYYSKHNRSTTHLLAQDDETNLIESPSSNVSQYNRHTLQVISNQSISQFFNGF